VSGDDAVGLMNRSESVEKDLFEEWEGYGLLPPGVVVEVVCFGVVFCWVDELMNERWVLVK
jgi:hypothetical protein